MEAPSRCRSKTPSSARRTPAGLRRPAPADQESPVPERGVRLVGPPRPHILREELSLLPDAGIRRPDELLDLRLELPGEEPRAQAVAPGGAVPEPAQRL